MYFFRFRVRPTKKNEEYGLVGGAYANCWVKGNGLAHAEQKVTSYLRHWKWRVDKIDATSRTNLKENSKDTVSFEHYKRAQKTGIAVRLHKWPLGTDDE